MEASAHRLPAVDDRWISRPRLVELLQRRWRHRIVTLRAGTGFGKTVALAQAIRENAIASSGSDFYVVCPPSSDPDTLAGRIAAGAGLPPDIRPERLSSQLVARLAVSGQAATLVLDDAHHISASSSALASLDDLIASLPEDVHFVLSGQHVLPGIDADDNYCLDEEDLAFTPAELDEIATRSDIDRTTLDGLGGWPALVFECAAVGRREGLDRMRERVLHGLDRDALAALSSAAVVGMKVPAIGERGLPAESWAAGLPLVRAGATGPEAHPVWALLVDPVLEQTELAIARRRGVDRLVADGRIREAVDCLVDAAQWDEVETRLIMACEVGHPPVERRVLGDWLHGLPEEMRAGPVGELLTAATWQRSDPVRAADSARAAVTGFRRQGNVAGQLAGLFQLGYLAWLSGQPEDLADVLQRTFELEVATGDSRAVTLAAIGRAALADLVRDHERVLRELDTLDGVDLGPELPALVAWLRSSSLLLLGDVDAALAEAEAAVCDLDPLDPFWVPAEGALLHALWLSGQFDEVVARLPAVVERARDSVTTHLASATFAQAACLYALWGDAACSAEHIALARSHGDQNSHLVAAHVALGAAAAAAADGHEEIARAALRASIERDEGVTRGVGADARLRLIALTYVLVPECRTYWDTADLPDAFAAARDVARLLLSARRTGTVPAGELPSADTMRCHLLMRWAVELAVAGAGHPAADRVLESLGPRARRVVRELADDDASPLAPAARKVLTERPVSPTDRVSIGVLGPTVVEVGGRRVTHPDLDGERVRHLLLYLIAHGPCPRSHVAAGLWPAQAPDAAAGNLRHTLHQALRILEPNRREGEAAFLIRDIEGNLALAPDPWLRIDARQFRDLVAQGRQAVAEGDPAAGRDRYGAALSLWRGDFLEDATYEDWAVDPQREFRADYVHTLIGMGALAIEVGEPAAAADHALAVLAVDRYASAAHEMRIRAHVRSGDLAAASEATEMYAAALEELGANPRAAEEYLASLRS